MVEADRQEWFKYSIDESEERLHIGAGLLGASLLLFLAPRPGVAGFQDDPRPSSVPCEDAVAVTYLANASVLLSGETRILIDGPFTTGVEPYPRFDAGALRAVRNGDPPFADVEWVLITHAHADHMDEGAIVDHLRSNSRARVVSTPEAIARIRESSGDDPGVAARLTAIEPDENRPRLVHDASPRIEALDLHHGRDRRVSNLGFLVEIDGVRILHVGDTEATATDLRSLSLPAPEYDGGLVRRLGGWEGVRAFLERFDPEPVALTERGAVVCVGNSRPLHRNP